MRRRKRQNEIVQLLGETPNQVQGRNRNTYSSAGAVGVDVGESAAVESFLHIDLSGLGLVPPDLQQLVLRRAGGRRSACEGTILWKRGGSMSAQIGLAFLSLGSFIPHGEMATVAAIFRPVSPVHCGLVTLQ